VSGNGTVKGVGIRCGGRRGSLLACEALFQYGRIVVLRAVPVGHSRFAGWSGFCQGKKLRCSVRVTAPKTVAALFRH
jgi:hypothetical protein